MGTGNVTQRQLAPAGAKARFFEPMLCLAVEKLPEGPAWQYEVKLDGYRAVGVRTKTGVELWSRNKDFSRRFPEVTRALEALPGRCYRRHRDQEFIEFLNSLARRYPGRELHLICDNYGTHSHSAVGQWLAAHPRFNLHFTPTSASWLNLVERWFGLISQQAIRRGSFDSVAQLERVITRFVEHWNQDAQPLVWTKTDSTDQTLHPYPKLISET